MTQKSKLTKSQQERVAQALVREYGWLGVRITVAREEVASGKWDDHPAVATAVKVMPPEEMET